MVCQKGQIWQVVGGIGKGGLKVRSGKELSSQELPGRLSVGALVLALEEEHGRLSYKLLSGSGPQNGWVSTKVQDKALLVATDDHWQQDKKDADARLRDLAQDAGQQSPATDLLQLYWRRFLQTADEGMDTSTVIASSEARSKENTRMVYPRKGVGDSFGLQNAKGMQLPHQDQMRGTFDNFSADDDIEEMSLCGDCGLPLGNQVFAFGDTQGSCLHGECAALRLQQNDQRLEDERQQRIKAVTDERRAEYDIGWKVARIPRNATCIKRLSQECAASASMYCLVLHTDPATQKTKVCVAPTLEPAAATNLEYLSIALAVHRKDGREPWFSLDPPSIQDCSDKKMQVKNFEPAWLANTSVGEVLFQADYYLKEASMGEVEQPVAGMRDTYELSRGTSYGGDMEWSAREWFMIRKASVQRSNDGVLIPCVKMGVEARGQAEFYNGSELVGLRDAKETSKDHPMAKYAEEFTRNFELIAERKSVIFQLREVAKAAVLARYLIASKAELEEQWFNLYDESTSFPNSPSEVPQLWHERYHEVIKLTNGDLPFGKQATRACAYGGVDLTVNPGGVYEHDSIPGPVSESIQNYGQRAVYGGMIPAALAGKSSSLLRAGGVFPSAGAGAGPIGAPVGAPRKRQLNWRNRRGGGLRLTTPQMPKRLGLGFEPQTVLPANLLASEPQVVPRLSSTQLTAPRALPSLSMSMPGPLPVVAGTVQAGVQARGIDLNLDKFCLLEADPAQEEAVAFDWGSCLLPMPENSASLLNAFWASVDGKRSSLLPCEDQGKSLLQTIFNPHQSDRREEGDQFIPPSTRFSHVQGLIDRVADEDSFRQRRMDFFCSPNFERNHPGSLFPRSWAPIVEVADAQDGENANRQSSMDAIVEHKLTIAALKALTPKFDKYTEDGTRFRIYSVGSLEVRTIQERDVAEVIGVVLSKSSSMQKSIDTQESWLSRGQSKVAKVSLYVERCEPNFGYFVVLETLEGNSTVTYLPNHGAARWEWNPSDLDQRRSLAKLINSADCTTVQDLVTINDVRNSCSTCENLRGTSSHSDRKDFAVGVCNVATKWLQCS